MSWSSARQYIISMQQRCYGKILYAQKAIQLSQKMYESGQCTKKERVEKTIELVIEMANAAKITITDVQHEIIVKEVQTIILLLP